MFPRLRSLPNPIACKKITCICSYSPSTSTHTKLPTCAIMGKMRLSNVHLTSSEFNDNHGRMMHLIKHHPSIHTTSTSFSCSSFSG
uniref:Ovule protein n=1 Tax=Ascaris lumbricoides TaxID=6252 RepID=A0A9J2P791_ASCLU